MSRGSQDVVIRVSADSAAAKQFAAVLQAGLEQAGNAVEQAGKKGAKSWDNLAAGADRLILKITGVQTATDLAAKALQKLWAQQQQLRQESVAPTVRMDDAIRRFLGTGGLRENQYGEVQSLLMRESQRLSIPFDQTAAMAEQALSSGISYDTIKNGGLTAIASGYVATGQVNRGDPQGFAKGLAQLTTSMGLDPTAENLKSVAEAVHVAKAQGNVEINELTEISNRAGIARQFGGNNVQEYLGMMAMLSRRGGTAEMATSLKNVTMELSTAGASPDKVKLLKELGLKPEDVDLVNESQATVMTRLDAALDQLPKEKQNEFMGKFFGERAVQSVPGLREGFDEVAAFMGQMQTGAMDEAIRVQATGNAAQLRRVENMELQAEAAGGFREEVEGRMADVSFKLQRARGELSEGDFFVNTVLNPLIRAFTENRRAQEENTQAQRNVEATLLGGIKAEVEMRDPVELGREQPARGRENNPPRRQE